VGTIALAAWLVSALVFLNAVPSLGDRFDFFLSVGFWVLVGAALAVFGSHRLETLRQQAQQARQLGQYVLQQTLGPGGMGGADVAKLLDFGLVHDPGHHDPDTKLTQAGGILGTPEFMSPEQARGDPAPDARGDLYSLGATAYYALTGRSPFARPTVIETLYAH